MMLLRYFLVVVLTLTGVWFFVDNWHLLSAHIPVALRVPLLEIRPLPPEGPAVWLMLLVSFALGFFLAYFLGMYRRFQSAMKIRKLEKQLKAKSSGAELLLPDLESE